MFKKLSGLERIKGYVLGYPGEKKDNKIYGMKGDIKDNDDILCYKIVHLCLVKLKLIYLVLWVFIQMMMQYQNIIMVQKLMDIKLIGFRVKYHMIFNYVYTFMSYSFIPIFYRFNRIVFV